MKNLFAYALLDYLRYFAKLQLLKNRPMIVGITGSGGKTSTMHAIHAVLQDSFSTVVSEKANSQSGLSLHILGISPKDYSSIDWLRMVLLAPIKLLTNWKKYDVYIAEMGIDGPSMPANMEYLLKIVHPKIGVFTSISGVHGEMFDAVVNATMAMHGGDATTRETVMKEVIAKEKGRLLQNLPDDGTAVYNGDDEIIRQIGKAVSARTISIGEKANNDVVCKLLKWKEKSTLFEVRSQQQLAQIEIPNHWLPKHFAHTFGAAVAVGLALGIDVQESARRIETHFSMPPGRATLIPAIHEATILDSSYNSSPASLVDLIQTIANLPKGPHFPTRNLALLGDMRELGSLTEQSHMDIARQAAKVFDRVYLVGPAMKTFALPVFEEASVPVEWFVSAEAAGRYIQQELTKGDLLLVKGSQNTLLLEIAVEQLMSPLENADALLCRRGTYWDKQRSKLKTVIDPQSIQQLT